MSQTPRSTLKLKNPASKANVDKDYDPTIPDTILEEPRENKRKAGMIRLVNPTKKRKMEPEIDTKLAVAKAKEIEEALGDLKSIESELALLDKQITKLPAVKLKVFSQTTKSPSSAVKRVRNRPARKNYDDDEIDEDDELIDDEDDDPYYKKKPSLIDHGNNFEESSLTDDEGDYDFSYGGVATNRSKRPPKPSNKYPDHVKSRSKLQRRERAEQRERERALQLQQESVNVSDVSVVASSPAVTSAPTPSRLRGKKPKPVLDIPTWRPIKAKPTTSSPEAMGQCKKVLQEIQKRPEAYSFLEPVNAVLLGLHDYHKIVKHPMDLSTVYKQLTREKKITSVEQFCQKMRLIWDNAVLYNGTHHEVGKLAIQLSSFFESRMKPIIAQENPQEVDASELRHKINIYTREFKSLQADLASLNASMQEPASMEVNPADPNIDLSPQIGNITEAESKKFEHAEKCQLYNAINGLQTCFLRGLSQLVLDSNDKHCIKIHSDLIEVDTDAAPPLLLTKLQLYIKECQAISNKDKKGPVDKTPGKITQQPQKEKSVESEKSSSTSETDSDSDDSSEGDPRLKTAAFSGIFDDKKQQPQKQPQQQQQPILPQSIRSPQQYQQPQQQYQQPQQQYQQPQLPTDATSKLILPTSPLVEERNVVLHNSESWSQLDSFETPKDTNTTSNEWESLRERKSQLELQQRQKEEQEILKNQQIKMKAEEEAKRVNEEMLEMKRLAELEQKMKKEKEEQERAQNIAKMRELEREKREKELNSGVLKAPVNMMDQFEIMKSFQANILPK